MHHDVCEKHTLRIEHGIIYKGNTYITIQNEDIGPWDGYNNEQPGLRVRLQFAQLLCQDGRNEAPPLIALQFRTRRLLKKYKADVQLVPN